MLICNGTFKSDLVKLPVREAYSSYGNLNLPSIFMSTPDK